MTQAIVERIPTGAGMLTLTPMDMLNQAVERGANIEVLEKLMALNERWQAAQARKAFDDAMAEAKKDLPVVIANRTGHNNKRYADFAAFAREVDPIITKHGLSYRFRAQQAERITVTCIVSHRDGHSEETTLSGPADKTGSKNDIQAIGSTLTYLQRYSLKLALGLASSEDDDGNAAGQGDKIDEQQAEWLKACIVESGADIKRFLAYMADLAKAKVEKVEDIPARLYPQAVDMLNRKKADEAAKTKKAEEEKKKAAAQ